MPIACTCCAERNKNPHRRRAVSSSIQFATLRKSTAPEEGWTEENFDTANGQALLRDLINVERFAMARGIAATTAFLDDMFARQFEDIVGFVEDLIRRTVGDAGKLAEDFDSKGINDIGLDGGAVFPWGQAITRVERLYDNEIIIGMTPKFQSVADEIFKKKARLLAYKPTRYSVTKLNARIKDVAREVTGINKTTRNRMVRVINKAVKEGKSVKQTAKLLREKFPKMQKNRLATIARTEMGKIADATTILSLQESRTVTYVHVVGCQAIEDGIPTYHGIPTCNIQYVPIFDAHRLKFHINHTGQIVPAAFKFKNGNVRLHRTRRGKG